MCKTATGVPIWVRLEDSTVRRWQMRYVRIAASALMTLGAAGAALAADGPSVTFTKDVAPIVYKSCAECHRPTMFAPMSLMTYDDARPYARAIKAKVVGREMAPWGVAP